MWSIVVSECLSNQSSLEGTLLRYSHGWTTADGDLLGQLLQMEVNEGQSSTPYAVQKQHPIHACMEKWT